LRRSCRHSDGWVGKAGQDSWSSTDAANAGETQPGNLLAALAVDTKAHPDQMESVFEQTEPGCAVDSMRLSHFQRRTGVHPRIKSEGRPRIRSGAGFRREML